MAINLPSVPIRNLAKVNFSRDAIRISSLILFHPYTTLAFESLPEYLLYPTKMPGTMVLLLTAKSAYTDVSFRALPAVPYIVVEGADGDCFSELRSAIHTNSDEQLRARAP